MSTESIGISDEWPYYMKLSKPDIQFGEWQLCPKCNGQGYVFALQTIGMVTCDVCNGAKILARPIIK